MQSAKDRKAGFRRKLGFEMMESRRMLSTTEILADINSRGATILDYSEGVVLDGSLYFAGRAEHATSGVELYRMDPKTVQSDEPVTEGAVTLMADINPGFASSSPYNLTVLNGQLYFYATDETHGTELWRLDPRSGNIDRITDSEAWPYGPNGAKPTPHELLAWNGRLYFTLYNSSLSFYKVSLYEYAPSAGNGLGQYERIADMGTSVYYNTHLFGHGNSVYFQSRWASEFHNESHTIVSYTPSEVVGEGVSRTVISLGATTTNLGYYSFATYSNGLFFSTYDSEDGRVIWKLDFERDENGYYVGVPQKILHYTAKYNNVYDLAVLDNRLYFFASNEDTGDLELREYDFRSIDVEHRFSVIGNLNTVSAAAIGQDLQVFNNRLFVKARDIVWQYNPNSELYPLQQLIANEEQPYESYIRDPSTFTLLNDQIFFSVGRISGSRLNSTFWTIDLRDEEELPPALPFADTARTKSSNPTYVTPFQGSLYFFANSGENPASDLWRYNLSSGHYEMVANLHLERYDIPANIVVHNGKLYFILGSISQNERSLWQYDLVADNGIARRLLTIPNDLPSRLSSLAIVQGELYITIQAQKLFRFEPETENQDAHLVSVSEPTIHRPGVELNGQLYFTSSSGDFLRYDPGTGQFFQINGYRQWLFTYGIYAVGNSIYLAVDGYDGQEFWKYDSTTDRLWQIYTFPFNTWEKWYPHGFIEAGGKIYFRARNENSGEELWQFDPSANKGRGKATLLTTINPELVPLSASKFFTTETGTAFLDNKIYFATESAEHSWEVWSYDTISGQARRETNFAQEYVSDNYPTIPPAELFALDGKIYFVATHHQFGREILVIDPHAVFNPTIETSLVVTNTSNYTAGDVNSEPLVSMPVFDDQHAPYAEVWVTLRESLQTKSFNLTFVIENSVDWLAAPYVVDSLGFSAMEVFVSEVSSDKAKVTLVGIDLSRYEIGDQILIARLKYDFVQDHDPSSESDNFTMNDGAIQLTSADTDFSTKPMPVYQERPVEFLTPAYDANGDGKVGLQDFALFISNYGKETGPDFPQAYHFDYDRDGRIGLRDFARFIRNYGKTAETFSTNMARLESPSGEEIMPEGEPIELDNDTYVNSKGLDALGISDNVPTISTATKSAMGSVEDIASPKTIPAKETPLLQSGDFIASVEQIFSQGFLLDTSTTAEAQFELDCALEITAAQPSSMILPKP